MSLLTEKCAANNIIAFLSFPESVTFIVLDNFNMDTIAYH